MKIFLSPLNWTRLWYLSFLVYKHILYYFSEFEVTGLDIAPSYEHGVYKADFLTLNISDTR